MSSSWDTTRGLAGFTALFLIGIGIVQVILGELVSHSVALTANGIDCIGDGIVSAIVWIGLNYFRKPADGKFHFGYYKVENLASVVAAIITVLLAAYIAYRSTRQLIDPHEVEAPLLGAGVALFAAIVAVGIGIYKFNKARKGYLSSAKLEAFNTVKDGTASFLAVIGIVVASLGFPMADAIVGYIIAIIIVTIAFMAIRESSLILVDGCDNACVDQSFVIDDIVHRIKGVKDEHIVKLRRSGPYYQGEMVIEVPGKMSMDEVQHLKDHILQEIQKAIPEVKELTITAVPYKKKEKK